MTRIDPVWQSRSTIRQSGPTTSLVTWALIAAVVAGALIVALGLNQGSVSLYMYVAVPAAVAIAAVLANLRLGRSKVAWGLAGTLMALCLLSVVNIGFCFLPAAILLMAAAFTQPEREPAATA